MAQVPALGEHGRPWHHRRQQDFPPQKSSKVLLSCMAGLFGPLIHGIRDSFLLFNEKHLL